MKISGKRTAAGIIIICIITCRFSYGAVITAAGEDNVFPYSYIENGEKKGIDYDILMEAGRRMNIEIRVDLVPWQRILQYMKSGRYDIGFTLFYVREREDFLIYTTPPTHVSSYSLFTKKGNGLVFNSIKDLYGRNVGNIRGYIVTEALIDAAKKNKIILTEVTEIRQLALLIQYGRIDYAISNTDVMNITLENLGLKDQIIPLSWPYQNYKDCHIVISKKAPNIENKKKFSEDLSRILADMKKDGTIKKINDSYLKSIK